MKYRINYQKKELSSLLAYSILTVVTLIVGTILLNTTRHNQVAGTISRLDNSGPISVEPQQQVEVNGKYLFSGTVVIARAVERYAVDENGTRDYSQPFSRLDEFEPDKYNAWIVDLECPVTEEVVSYQRQIQNLVFNCPPEFLPEMAKYFDIFNLANNHTSDMGIDGFKTTQSKLSEAGFQHVGNYNPAVEEDVCEVIALSVNVITDGDTDEGKLPVAFCAWQYFFRDPLGGELEVMEKYTEIMPVFALQHAGLEYVATAGGNQVPIARKLVDLGAEFVIGNSPHWVQNTEVYKGKLIAYSTGNFIFDQLEKETNRGANYELTISVQHDENLQRWLELGDECAVDNDDCLDKSTQLGLEKVDLDLQWGIVGSLGGAGEITRLADSATQEAIEVRANWSDTLKALEDAIVSED